MVIGVPVGIAAAHRPWLFALIRPVLDLMQTIPTFVYLIPTLILFGLGVVPGLISTVIFAIPAPIRLTASGRLLGAQGLIEAGEAFGASRSQLLWKVELPHALPTIMAGLTQCIMLSLSMVVIAALVGAGGPRRARWCAPEHGQHRPRLRGRARHRHPRHHSRPGLQAARAGQARWLSHGLCARDRLSGRRHRLRRSAEDGAAAARGGETRETILERTGQILGVADCTLAIPEGEICVLMGLSGSGKSTLLRAVNRLNR
jgi:hypothetical protein